MMLQKRAERVRGGRGRFGGAVSGCEFAFAPCMPEPERIVGLGFRHWYSGYLQGDILAWEKAWTTFGSALGSDNGRAALEDLSRWVKAVRDHSSRDIAVFPSECRSFCRDECIAISMIAAAQHSVCPAMRACAFALLGCSVISDVLSSADRLAATLRRSNVVLSSGSVIQLAVPVDTSISH
jgi:hypothetical protein